MPTLSFKKQFCPRVESGEKTHSLRSKRKRAWKVGDYLGLYYALRTNQARLLGKTTVVRVQDVELSVEKFVPSNTWRLSIRIDGEQLSFDEAEAFAQRDGFPDLVSMRQFWHENNDLKPDQVWRGDLIHWKFPFNEADPGGKNARA